MIDDRTGADRAIERLAKHRERWEDTPGDALNSKREKIEARKARREAVRQTKQPIKASEIAARRRAE